MFGPFNLFRYLTFRSIAAFLTALVLSFLIGGGLIRWLRSKQAQGQPIREDGPASHIVSKKGTPTMGGLLILIALSVATLLWADLTNRYVWIVLASPWPSARSACGTTSSRSPSATPRACRARSSSRISVVVAGVGAYLIAQASPPPLRYTLALPFLKDVLMPLGLVGFVAFSRAGDRRRLQRGQPHRRARWAGDRPGDHGVGGVRPDRLRRRQHHLHQLPLPPSRAARRRAGRAAGGAGRRRARLPVVQRAARHGVHGRHRLAVDRRRAGRASPS